ncbi:MAG: DUF1127 domain-containing protein [Kiloniellaceae bacterium]
MSILSTGASCEASASPRQRKFPHADLDCPDVRWRTRGNPLGRALLSLFFATARPLIVWQQRVKDREALKRLPDHMLRDIGIDPMEALEAARKPFWRA